MSRERHTSDVQRPGEAGRADPATPATQADAAKRDRWSGSAEARWQRRGSNHGVLRTLLRPAPMTAEGTAPPAPHPPESLRAYRWYLAAVGAVGLCLLAWAVTLGDWEAVALSPWEYALFCVFIVLGELMPIEIARHGSDDTVTVSTAFAFATLLAFGMAPAIGAYVAASVVFDVLHRSPARRLTFNAGQYALSLAAAAGVLSLVRELPYPSAAIASELPAIFVAAAASFLVNTALAGTAPALLSGARVVGYLRSDLGFQFLTSGLLLALSPVIVIAADASLALTPLLFLPMVAIYVAGKQSLISEYHATHDALTGLPNRALLHDRLEHDLELTRRNGKAVAVMILDLDDFKDVNDTLGHAQGDLLLQAIGPRFTNLLRGGDTLARLGGDEFAVVLPNISERQDAIAVAARITDALERPFAVAGLLLDVRISIGIACFPGDGDDVGVLLRHADVALYEAKHSKTACAMYSPEDDEHTRERLALAAQLRRGIAAGELELHYQPKVTLPDLELCGVEALVRWRHPQLGLLPPSAFIPLAEQTGLIRPLTERVLDEALRQARCWRDAGIEFPVAVNLSTHSLPDRSLSATLRQLLDKWQLTGAALQLEITESAVIEEARHATAALGELSALGIRLAIDDFGTGYSSLAYLRRLPVSEIKIDKSFVCNMAASREDAVIVRSTISLARDLGLVTTAEGVEDEATCRQLTAWGCQFAQGFLLGRPVRGSELMQEARRSRFSRELAEPSHGDTAGVSQPRLAAIATDDVRHRGQL